MSTVATTNKYRCSDGFSAEIDKDCSGTFLAIPGLKEVTWNFNQQDGIRTQNCDTDNGAASGAEIVEIKAGSKEITGFIRGDRCFDSDGIEPISTLLAEGATVQIRSYIENQLGIVDNTVFHQADIRIGCEATVTNSKDNRTIQEYNIPFTASNYIKPVLF